MEKATQADGVLEDYQDEDFAYIVGYTSWGFPYGVTWEEWEEMGPPELQDLDPESRDADSQGE